MRNRDFDRAITGRVWIEDGFIKNRSTLFGDWDVRIADLKLVGEATNENGAFVDDWMWIFVTDADGWQEASMYATTDGAFARQLGLELDSQIQTGFLAGSATFNSRIAWPTHLAGQPIFRNTNRVPRNLLDRLWQRVFGAISNVQTFTDEVVEYLRRDGTNAT